MVSLTDYQKYRGKCREMSEALAAKNPGLRLVRGHYHCPTWGPQQHWWCEDKNGAIYDPTADQFPSKGGGRYEEFGGNIVCEVCGEEKPEAEAYINGRHVYCSRACYYTDVM